jgi:hypothetical protein
MRKMRKRLRETVDATHDAAGASPRPHGSAEQRFTSRASLLLQPSMVSRRSRARESGAGPRTGESTKVSCQ